MIEARRVEITDLCRQFHVRRLDLFGSAARDNFDSAASDLDFLVEFEPLPPIAYADAYFALKSGLETLFGRPVDLVTYRSVINPYFRADLEAHRQAIYAA